MDYELTEHARDALEKRQIHVKWMEHVLRSPEATELDPVDSDLEHRLARISAFGNRVLRVIINVNRTPPHVITLFFDRRKTIP
jgi:hypothetical protein